jgi:tetratricopeptide (TPR) repeat protein
MKGQFMQVPASKLPWERFKMEKSTVERLDVDELLQLALQASKENRNEQSITYLKRALDLKPREGRLHYMLAAEHAQMGLYDRAAEEMAKAVELDPSLVTAYFQLGLLHLTSGRVAQAESAWRPLDQLGPDHFLHLFKTGMLHLARDEFKECKSCLERGIKANNFNEALNVDMRRVLQDVQERLGKQQPGAIAAGTEPVIRPSIRPSGRAVLSAYRENRGDDEGGKKKK